MWETSWRKNTPSLSTVSSSPVKPPPSPAAAAPLLLTWKPATLTLDNATIENMGGNYGYGGAINSGLANLTIRLMGNNTIRAQRVGSSAQIIRDSINSNSNCNIKIVSGDTGTPTLTCDVIDMGRGGPYNGGENAGNLMVDGVNLTVNDYVFVQHDITFQNGAQVNVTGRLTANHNAVITVEGENTDVTVESISMGNGTAHLPNDNKLVLKSGALTITESVAFPGTEDGDRNPYAIHFDPANTGSIEITGGTFQTREGGLQSHQHSQRSDCCQQQPDHDRQLGRRQRVHR